MTTGMAAGHCSERAYGKDCWRDCRYATRDAAFCAARIHQRRLARKCYVVQYAAANDAGKMANWLVTTDMPMMGEWYDADGIRHG